MSNQYDDTNTVQIGFNKDGGKFPSISVKINIDGNELDLAVWPNDKKGNDRAPDYTGTLKAPGATKRVALWKRSPGFITGTVEEPRPNSEQAAVVEDEDIPF